MVLENMVTLMTIQEAILDTLQHLPFDKQQEVLDFAQFLRQKASPIPSRSLKGLWVDLDFDLTEADLAEARQQMWSNFPRESLE